MVRSKKRFGQGRSPSRFSYTYEDFASVLGCSTAAIRKHAQRGNFDPNDLVSVLEFIQLRLKGEVSLAEVVKETRRAASGGSED
jgi:hypothetical protein